MGEVLSEVRSEVMKSHLSYGTFSEIGGGVRWAPPHPKFLFGPKNSWKVGNLYFQIYWIKIDHFRGLIWPLEVQRGESKNHQKKSEKWGICTFRYTGSKSTIFEVWLDPKRVRVVPRFEKWAPKGPKTGPFWSILGLHVKNGKWVDNFFQTP